MGQAAKCGEAAKFGVELRALTETEPRPWAGWRNRGLEMATKSGVSFRYLGLRVARAEPGVNAGC